MRATELLALALLVAGCAHEPVEEVVQPVSHFHVRQQETRVVVRQAPALRVVDEKVQATPPVSRPATTVLVMQAPAASSTPSLDYLRVGPPIVLNTVAPGPTATPPALVQTPVVERPAVPVPAITPAVPDLPTAPEFTYQNGGVNGTTRPPVPTKAADLPTAEGFDYRP